MRSENLGSCPACAFSFCLNCQRAYHGSTCTSTKNESINAGDELDGEDEVIGEEFKLVSMQRKLNYKDLVQQVNKFVLYCHGSK